MALQQARQRLEQVERLAVVGQLAPGIAHELNTPLGVIISNLTVLAAYGDSLAQVVGGLQAPDLDYILEDLPALTSESIASANRIAEIVRSLALLARNDAQRLGPVNVEDALQAAITLTWHELKQRATLERDYGGVPAVVGSVSELAQVFVYLLLNAAQAVPERGGVVSVSTTYADGEVTIRIAANGAGSQSSGLSICQEIMTRHQGTIDIQSDVGSGTRVTIRLHAAPGTP